VVSPGEYAVRGGLIDLFPMGSPVPYRVDLFGDEIDSIRTFDPDSQRSLYPVPEVRLLPGREFPMDEAARTAFRARWRERSKATRPAARIYKDIAQGIASGGIEYYLPLFFDRRRRSSTTWAAAGGAWCCTARSTPRCSASGSTRASATASCSTTPSGRSCRPRRCSCAPRSFFALTQPHATLALRGNEPCLGAPAARRGIDRGATEPLAALERHLDSTPHRVLIVAESEGRRESVLDLLRDHKIVVPSVATLAEFLASDEKVAIAAAPLAAGFHWHEPDGRHQCRSSSSPRPSSSPARRRPGAGASRSRSATSTR
jgi:transcription-repair coupling factor (superfamily II helicase)